MKSALLRSLSALAVVVALYIPSFAQSKVSDRITQPIDNSQVIRLKGNVHPRARSEFDRGPVEPTLELRRVTLVFKPSKEQQASLDTLLDQQQDPNSPNYHKWLTPAQFGDRFGLAPTDFGRVQAWLTSQGFNVVDAPRSRTYIAFTGNAWRVEAAFRTQIHQYIVEGEKHFANISEPAIPAALASVAQGLTGLDDFKPKSRSAVTRRVRPNFTSSISGNHFLAPDDFATIYNLKSLYNNGLDGTGQTIAVMGQTNINVSDTAAFRAASGLPAKTPQLLLVPGVADPGIVTTDIHEANLDVQWSGAVARNATILFVYSDNVFKSLQYAITANLAPVISISYGDCEAHFTQTEINSLSQMGQQANAQGQTIVAASGDSGAADCDYQVTIASNGFGVDLPAALPYVTGMGGTTFNEGTGTFWNPTNNSSNGSAISYIPEVAWNDTAIELANNGHIAASGGGVSTKFGKPSWQTGTGVPADAARDVPDISFAASADHDGYLTCVQGSCVNGYRATDNSLTVSGGTSAGAPVFAGVVALINQNANARQGNVNPTLYAMAASAPSSFHDITTGDNKVPCLSGTKDCTGVTSIGYSAGAGYDLVTGLGTVDVSNLVTQWPASQAGTPDFQASAAASAMTIARIATPTSGTQNITFTAVNGFTGTIALTCSVSTSLTGVTCTMNPTSLNGGGTSILTVNVPARGSIQSGAAMARLMLPFTVGFMFIGGLVLSDGERSKRRNLYIVIALVLLIFVSMGAAGCGGGGSSSSGSTGGTPISTPLNGTITVHATSGTLTHTLPITVTVN